MNTSHKKEMQRSYNEILMTRSKTVKRVSWSAKMRSYRIIMTIIYHTKLSFLAS